MVGGEDLSQGAAAVVADEIDLREVERLTEHLEHLRDLGKGEVRVCCGSGLAVSEEVDRDAAADVAQPGEDVTPEVAVEKHAVHEQRGRTAAPLLVSNIAVRRGGEFNVA